MQVYSRDGDLASKSTWQTVVLIPKGDGRYSWRVGLVGVLCNNLAELLN